MYKNKILTLQFKRGMLQFLTCFILLSVLYYPSLTIFLNIFRPNIENYLFMAIFIAPFTGSYILLKITK